MAHHHLTIGPRNRRRVAIAAAIAVVVIAVAAAVILTRSTSHHAAPPLTIAASPASIRYQANRSKVIFGMTHQQVRHLVGPPTKVVGTCWQYPPYAARGGPSGKSITTADRLCFYSGRYSTKEFWLNGKWAVSCAAGVCPPEGTR